VVFDDLHFAEGKKDELLGRIEKRTGETQEAVEKALKDLILLRQANSQGAEAEAESILFLGPNSRTGPRFSQSITSAGRMETK
jgi:hypothetical protein